MNIAYYMPFKPMGHPNPSGDLVIGTELYRYFRNRGHHIDLVSRLRSRWLFLKPWAWGGLAVEAVRTERRCRRLRPDVWLSYHSYYKAPDLLGPFCCGRLRIPYVIFQGMYSTSKRRRLKTLPGFLLNRRALISARIVFTNKKVDELNLLRLLPSHRVIYVPPGIHPADFCFDPEARKALRESWQAGRRPVVMTAAMFRPGVKVDGIMEVIDACARLVAEGVDLRLVIAGDGSARERLEQHARGKLPGVTRFLGKIARPEMNRYYSAADLFAFPGIEESLGMVYLEAQSCGLPVVAFKDWGASEAVVHNRTGLLAGAARRQDFVTSIKKLVMDQELRTKMGLAGVDHVRQSHDLMINYGIVEKTLQELSRLKGENPGR